jgi:hypothetical protein
MSQVKPVVVVSVHGIRTRGVWQKNLDRLLSARGIAVHPYDYGHYNLFKFLRPSCNQRMVDAFCAEYDRVVSHRDYKVNVAKPHKRPSVIAHSLGSFIVGSAMQKYDYIKFDKLIICGSILPRDFDWSLLLQRGQVLECRNEYGKLDFWAGNCRRFVRGTGDSGRAGFHYNGWGLEEQLFPHHRHSDYFESGHMTTHWINFLCTPCPPLEIKHSGEMIRNGDHRQVDAYREQAHGIDIPVYHDTAETEIPRGLSATWLAINSDIYTFLINDRSKRVTGYINAMPLTDSAFAKMKAGALLDREITDYDVVPYANNRVAKLYLMSIALDPNDADMSDGLLGYRMHRLISGLCHKLTKFAQDKRVAVVELLAVAWTAQGEHLCQLLGLDPVGKDRFGHTIYWARLDKQFLTKQKIWKGLLNIARTYEQLGLLSPPAPPIVASNFEGV